MNASSSGIKSLGFFGKSILPSVEYVAENAYIPPGFHRLLTAGGLTAGLWAGRSVMDVVTATDNGKNKRIARDQVFWPLRPLYGTMVYNQYSDNANDRWKQVADKLAPMVFGGVAAWAASRHFFYGKNIAGKAFHPATEGLLKRYSAASQSGKVTLETADSMMVLAQAEAQRKLGAAGMVTGSSTGTQLPGALFPFTNGGGMATNFQLGAGLRINLPGFLKFLNPLVGNRAGSTRTITGSLADVVRWAEANIRQIGHPDHWIEERTLSNHIKSLTQNFARVSPEQRASITATVRQLITDAYAHAKTLRDQGKSEEEIAKAIAEFLEGNNPTGLGFKGVAYEKLLIQSGFDLTKFQPGYGSFGILSSHLGSENEERKIEANLARHLKEEHGIEWGQSRFDDKSTRRAVINWTALAGISGGLIAGGIFTDHINKRLDKDSSKTISTNKNITQGQPFTATTAQRKEKKDQTQQQNKNPLIRWIDGKPLDTMQWISNIFITPPSMHRFMNAAYLSGALWGGMQFANALAGRKLGLVKSGNSFVSLLPKEEAGIFKSLHGKLAYTPSSTLLQDRVRQSIHYLIPVGFGMFGTYTGSHLFFHDRIEQLKKPQTLEDYADKISLEQSKPYGALTALTSIFNTGTGIHLLPFFSYSSNMHNRYLLASGQQVALPGVGQWWSGNAGLNPWGVKKNLDHMTEYLTYNPSARLKEMSALVHSVIGKLYPKLDEGALLIHKQAVLDRIYEIRDSYLENGTIPKEKQPALHKAMKKLLHGEGLENLLQASGLDPAKANLASNGASGDIANFLGTKGTVTRLQKEYRHKFTERTANASVKNSPNDYLRALADSRPDVMPAANDNQGKASFAERVKSENPANPTLGA